MSDGYVKDQSVYDDLRNRFSYHPPKGDQGDRYVEIRDQAHELAKLMVGLCPNSHELSLALTNLEDSVMWANASIARNE